MLLDYLYKTKGLQLLRYLLIVIIKSGFMPCLELIDQVCIVLLIPFTVQLTIMACLPPLSWYNNYELLLLFV